MSVALFLEIWSLTLGIIAFIIGLKGYVMPPTPPGVIIIGKTFPYVTSDEGEALLGEEGIEYANVRSWSTRNAAIGLACIIAGGFLQSKDAYVLAFIMCVYREASDVFELFVFEPKDKMKGTAYGFMGLLDILALYYAYNM